MNEESNRSRKGLNKTGIYTAYTIDLESRGINTFTRKAALDQLGVSQTALKRGLNRLKRKGRILAVTRDFFVIVPNEYRLQGAPPTSWFIRQLAGHLGVHYYVGLLSAAELHGAAHQRPQAFQAVISKYRRDIRTKHIKIDFCKKANADHTPVIQRKTPTGFINVSSPAATALDLVIYYRAAGGLSRVGSLLNELAETLNPAALRSLMDFCSQLPPLQRLGYLLDYTGHSELTRLLHYDVRRLKPRPCALHPGLSTKRAQRSKKWNVYVNTEIEAEP